MPSSAGRACRVAAVVFGIVSGLHAWRLAAQPTITVNGWSLPMAASWVALVVSGALAWWIWRSARG